MREEAAEALLVYGLRSRHRPGAMAGPLQRAADLRGDEIEALVDYVIAVVPVIQRDRAIGALRQLIDNGMREGKSHGYGAWI